MKFEIACGAAADSNSKFVLAVRCVICHAVCTAGSTTRCRAAAAARTAEMAAEELLKEAEKTEANGGLKQRKTSKGKKRSG